MRIPFLATLLVCGLWWLSSTMTTVHAQQDQGDEAKSSDQSVIDELEQKARAAAEETRRLAEEAKEKAREALDLEDRAKKAREAKANQGPAHDRESAQSREDEIRARVGEKAHDVALRSTAIAGMKVRNRQGEDIGSIDDVMIDAGSGEIRYAALGVGGFFGIGDKLVAIPWKAFEVRQVTDGAKAEYILVADLPKDRINAAHGFDKSQWPAYASDEFKDLTVPKTASKPDETRQK